MDYWGAYCNVSSDPPTCFDPDGIPKNGDGRCQGWQGFFIDILKTQSISSEPVFLVAKRRQAPTECKWLESSIIVRSNRGQGDATNPAPVKFNGHAIVKARGKLYDPSYGTGPFADIKAWENASLLAVTYKTGDPVENTPDKEETENDDGNNPDCPRR